MTFKTYDINVDLVTDASTTCAIRFSQNDKNSAKLLLTITNKGVELDLSQAKSVRMSFKKPDGTRVFQNDCQPINALKGKYQILLKTQTLTSVGNVIAQIHIEEEDRTIDTQKFFFVVNESLLSNEAIESTNEFPVIQKAIEAGKKLTGVDIDGIIAAGVKADGALKKTGGTMTGYLEFDVSNFEKVIRGKDGAINQSGLSFQKGATVMYDWAGSSSVWAYTHADKKFIVHSDTNLLKKTGDTMQGSLSFTQSKELQFKRNDGVSLTGIAVDEAGDWFAWNSPGNKYLWKLDGKTGEFAINADNLVSKGGGAVTGQLVFTKADPISYRPQGNKWWLQIAGTSGMEFIPSKSIDKDDWDWGRKVRLNHNGSIRQADDTDWTTIPATDDAVQTLSGGIQAKRSGNIVNLTIGIKALQALSAKAIATLPSTFHPQKTINQTYISEQGTANNIWVTSAGAIAIHMPVNHSAYINLTYVI
ncbi:TPA: BppU family phage baseplate upper protein [Bacillus mobilis]|uniref:BppU family phage baseplate upper protein n=1 Tax=Bacillus mobilis TaxID=2026190 RepID=UPI00119DCB38|nr:BppU family phage baseplate upper protein [Bacillus mobilis]MED4385006.1 BppU family phage baseplate upper protein [Bacillus mobilis]HDX9638974.1 BppU family phage baseplate upper protein [Bacillus mobilis]